jgi:uncharacterized protein
MGERNAPYPTGVPSWVDLNTTDPAGAREFYGQLFGWQFDIGGDEFGNYTMAKVGGKNVAGLGGQPGPAPGTFWTTYLATDDIDTTAKAIKEEGGSLMMEPMEIPGSGKMTIAVDPTGAAFGVWQAQGHIGSELVNAPGSVVWNELLTPDLDRDLQFYANVFGYTYEEMPGDMRYALMQVGGRTCGGMMPLPTEMAGIPPNWSPYFEVADIEATVADAQKLGGAVMRPITDIPPGQFAVLADPQGGVFCVMKSTNADD